MKSKIFRLSQLITIILILLITPTCKKYVETEIDPDGIIISDEVNIIPDADWDANFIAYDTTSSTLTFSADIANNLDIKQGDIIVSARGNGLLRRVSSIQAIDNKLIIATSDASLTEAIKQGTFEFDTTLTTSQIKSIEYHYEGISLKNQNLKSTDQTQLNWDINSILYDLDGQSTTTGDQIKLVGNFSCDWTLKAKINIGIAKGLKEVNFGFESNEELNLKLIAGLEYNFEKTLTLVTIKFAPIITTVGIVPVVFTPQLKINVGVNGYANASITTSIEQGLSFDAGIQYLKDEGWKPYKQSDESFKFQPPQLNLNAGAEAYLKPELSMKLYGIAGPYANLKLYSKLDANLLETPWWTLKGGIKMNAGGKFEILDKFLVKFEVNDLLEYEKLIAQANTPPNQISTVSTGDITAVTDNSATASGNVTDDGGATVTARGVCWSTSQNPTISNSKTNDGTGTGSFTSSLTGLTENTTYFVRAYATNGVGTAYGSQKSFTTEAAAETPSVTTSSISDITQTAATGGGNVTDDGGATVTARGVCWSTSQYPTISNSKTNEGTGTGSFTSSLTGLTENTTYFVRAYATNGVGTAYGSQKSFTTEAAAETPSVTTNSISDITQTTATGGGQVTDDGGATVAVRGVCWSTSSSPTISNSHTSNGTGIGSFTSVITGLTAGTTYHVRAYATNSVGTAYGTQRSFTTNGAAGLPTLSTNTASNITETTATSGGNITTDGGATVTARGVCWSTSSNPTISNSHTSNGTGTGSFTSSITGLSASTKYYVRSYATNSKGTAYGNELSFTTTSSDDEGITFGDYAITTLRYKDSSNWEQIINDVFGPNYRVADWTDLKAFYANGGDLLALFDGLGLTEYGNAAFVTRNGDHTYSSTRYYFASRHEHNKPSSYLAHDNIDNYLISLGSWYATMQILAIKK